MREYALVWDIETVPDPSMIGRVKGHRGMTPKQAKEVLRGSFPKLIWHKIVCIGALIASRSQGEESWGIDSIGAPHVAERSERDLIESFVERIGDIKPLLISYNGWSFDLPVIRFRAMHHGVNASGLMSRNYFARFSGDSIDLCDLLSSFIPQAKISLEELSKSFDIVGKSPGMSGSKVEDYFYQGRMSDISKYCQSDVVATYRIWLRHELFKGSITRQGWEISEIKLSRFLQAHPISKV